ncbi:hypothetical protein [Nocardiopsis ganjiahuensis]|uniref:hypothetical protein n=1 Tax=Nocardiopsis ganjiahuensis TaxID=239984 RepID=UPI001955348B|nr:hypothetical protein [Nocardiopsis ganjiahuensis]
MPVRQPRSATGEPPARPSPPLKTTTGRCSGRASWASSGQNTHLRRHRVLLALDTPAERRLAIAHTERAITLCTGPTRSTGDLLAARLDLATAHLRNHDPDGALEQIDIICASPPEQRTASITQRARRLIPLTDSLHAPPVREIRDHLSAFTPTPAGHSPNAGR